MPPTKDSLRNEFANLFQEVLNRKIGLDPTVGMKDLAGRIGVHYQTFIRWPKGTRPIHAHKLALLSNQLNDMTLLDWLESQVGRVAYTPVPTPSRGDTRWILEVLQFIKTIAEALEDLCGEAGTGRVDKDQIQRTLAKLDGVIRECLRLKGWVNQQYSVGRGKT
jgi:hypothetical protein